VSAEKTVEFIREGDFLAEVDVELRDDAGEWSPAYSLEDARKLEATRKALRCGDIVAASRRARVFEVRPVMFPAAE
jgi:hypothetical protein